MMATIENEALGEAARWLRDNLPSSAVLVCENIAQWHSEPDAPYPAAGPVYRATWTDAIGRGWEVQITPGLWIDVECGATDQWRLRRRLVASWDDLTAQLVAFLVLLGGIEAKP